MLKTINIAFRAFFKKGRNNLIKILSLGVGLAMGLVLIAKIYMVQSYDTFFPDADRIYIIRTNYTRPGEDGREYSQVSGAIAPGMKAGIPEVEAATRYTYNGYNTAFFTGDKHKLKGTFILADSCFFDVFPRRILAGNVKEVLSRPMYVMVSREIADRMGGVEAAMGQTIESNRAPGKIMTVGGVFETLPDNTHFDFDIVISMISIGQFSYDGSNNWMGNDRYIGYVKLLPGVTPESVAPGIRRMQEDNQPLEELEKEGVKFYYSLYPMLDMHKGTPETKRMLRLLGLLAFAILFTAVMNYILIMISSLVSRSKEMAVNKCYGASEGNIYRKMLSETFVHLIISLMLAFILILVSRKLIYHLLDASLESLFSLQAILILLGICIVIFFISGLVPGYLFARIPVSSAFRNYTENRRYWKLGLLFFQFIAAGFLVTLVTIITMQYNYMVGYDPGYNYENLSYSPLSGMTEEQRQRVLTEVGSVADVADVTISYQLPMFWASGNNVLLPGQNKELFNIADFYQVGNGYFNMMQIPILEGRSFRENVSSSDEVMVSRSFVEKMKNYADWSDGPIGKGVIITEHSPTNKEIFTICGIYEDFRIGSIGQEDLRPSVMFYSNVPSGFLLIKYVDQNPDSNRKIQELMNGLFPDRDNIVVTYASEMEALYSDSRRFKDSVLLGGLVALLISAIGLIGYTNDEMNRRRKETAIRKVNGATIRDILLLFMADITRMALPALILAGGIAAYVASQWQSQFSEKISLSFLLFIVCGLTVLWVILSVVAVNCYSAATENPAENVKSE